jgi:hypothetical protein
MDFSLLVDLERPVQNSSQNGTSKPKCMQEQGAENGK